MMTKAHMDEATELENPHMASNPGLSITTLRLPASRMMCQPT